MKPGLQGARSTRRSSLAARLGWILATLLILQVLLSVGTVAVWFLRLEERSRQDSLKESARILLPAFEDSLAHWAGVGPPLSRVAEIRHRMQRSLGAFRSTGLVWADRRGNHAAAGFLAEHPLLQQILECLDSEDPSSSIGRLSNRHHLPMVVRETEAGYVVLAIQTGERLWHKGSFWLLGVLLGIAALAAGTAAWLLARHLLQRFSRFHRAFRELGQGKFGHRLLDRETDELGELAREFDQMACRLEELTVRLEESDQKRRRLVHEVSHELGTPLTNIIGYLEALLREGSDGGKGARPKLEVILSQARRLDLLVGDLLDLARIEDPGLRLRREGFDLRRLVQDEVAGVELACLDRGIALKLELPDKEFKAWGDPQRIGQILRNLLRNSIQQLEGELAGNPEKDAAIQVRVTRNEAELHFLIRDNGPGIEAADLPHLFDRFYRSGAQAGLGSGLGLAISRQLALLHDGDLEVRSEGSGRGAEFLLRIPSGGAG